MITIFFPAGGFGTTLEYAIRKYALEFESIDAEITDNGSMHSMIKEFHPATLKQLKRIKRKNYKIITPVWPGLDMIDPSEYVKKCIEILPDTNVIFVSLDSKDQYELNELFAYYKTGKYLQQTVKNYKMWNHEYASYTDMLNWELRENLSLRFNPEAYIEAKNEIKSSWLSITPHDILYDFPKTLSKMFNYLNLTFDTTQDLLEFYNQWFKKQEYVINEYNLIKKILLKFESDTPLTWKPLSIVGEAIIQAHLLRIGYQLNCYGLDKFPVEMDHLKQVSIPIED